MKRYEFVLDMKKKYMKQNLNTGYRIMEIQKDGSMVGPYTRIHKFEVETIPEDGYGPFSVFDDLNSAIECLTRTKNRFPKQEYKMFECKYIRSKEYSSYISSKEGDKLRTRGKIDHEDLASYLLLTKEIELEKYGS
jgi:hypothetical protein